MKVLDLQCQHGHVFEGWFGSEQDYQDQLLRGLVECPMCGDAHISKRVTAARLNLSGSKEPAHAVANADSADPSTALATRPATPQPSTAMAAHMPPEMQAAWMQMAQHVMANTTDVGTEFAAEARRIHDGQAPERAIRGQATRRETMELLEDGIAVMPLPLPVALKQTLQ